MRMGDVPDDASLAARRVAIFALGLYASSDYLARQGVPLQPSDLLWHEGLRTMGR